MHIVVKQGVRMKDIHTPMHIPKILNVYQKEKGNLDNMVHT